MDFILGRHKVEDMQAWKNMMEAHREGHLALGLHFQQVWTNADRPTEIFFLFRVDDLNKAKAGLKEAGALDREKQQHGEIPELFFLEEG